MRSRLRKIEYLKFEEGTPFPEVLHRCPHVAYKVDSLEKYREQCAGVGKDAGTGAVACPAERNDCLHEHVQRYLS